MVKDLKYIIKRIIIGTGIAFAIMALKGNFMLQAHALQAVSSWNMPAQESSVTTDTNAVFWYTNTTPFANQGDGELLFNFSITKQYGDPTAPVLAPRFVRVHSGNDTYVCYIGSSTVNNSTFTDGTYSAICPMHLESAGVTSVVVGFQNLSTTNMSSYIVRFNGFFTWKRDYEYTLLDAINNKLNNIGNSDIISNNNQNTQNIINNQNNNNQSIINNQNNNTQAIVDSQQDINNTLNDDSGGEVSSSWFDEFKDSSTTPVSDLLTMPITLLQAYLNGFSANCQAMNLGSLYGSYIIIPCLNIESYLGSPLWSLIDVLFSLFMLYNIGMLCVTIYEGITSLDDDMQMLYSPQHAGAGDTRVERYGDNY